MIRDKDKIHSLWFADDSEPEERYCVECFETTRFQKGLYFHDTGIFFGRRCSGCGAIDDQSEPEWLSDLVHQIKRMYWGFG